MKIPPIVWLIALIVSCEDAREIDTLHHQQTVNGLRYSLLSADGIWQHQQDSEGYFSHYLLRIERLDGQHDPIRYRLTAEDDYSMRLQYYAHAFTNDVYILSGTDTIPCAFHHLEPSYGIAPYVTQVLSFEWNKAETQSAARLVVFDRLVMSEPIYIKL